MRIFSLILGLCQVSAYTEHLLKLSYCNNVRIVREHHLVKLFQFCFSHLLNLLCEKKAARYVQLCTWQQIEWRFLSVAFSPFYPNVVFVIPAPISAASPCSYHRKVISHSDGHSILENQINFNFDLQIYYSFVLTQRQYFCIMLFVVI